MRWTKVISLKVFTVLVFCGILAVNMLGSALAESAPNPSLIISQLKITSSNGQFVTLYNTTNTVLDMNKFQLAYFNSYDLGKATSSRLIALSGSLPPHSYYMLNDSSLNICYQITINSINLGFSSVAGMIQLVSLNQLSVGGSITPVAIDYASWSKTAVSGAQTLPASTNAFLLRQPLDTFGNPIVSLPGSGSWLQVQPDVNKPCQLVTNSSPSNIVNTGMNQLLPPSEPGVVFVNSQPDAVSSEPSIPVSDIGLKSPLISELLPNPSPNSVNASEEYIELYNPNDKPFDLSGFILQSGLSTVHKYSFTPGTVLAPNSFTAFYTDNTGLTLSNTNGVVKLFDPLGNSIYSTANYSSAKTGQAWALNNGVWAWTGEPTPGAANKIILPALVKTKALKSQAKKPSSSKQKTSKTSKKPKKAKKISMSNTASEPVKEHSLQAWALAIIICLALLYACYEYRTDISNKIYKLRQHFRNRQQLS